MKHVMVDLETLGKRPGFAIRSIGAVSFDREGDLGETFYRNIDRLSCSRLGLLEDAETVAWWDAQSVEARECLDVDPRTILDVIRDFHDWFSVTGAEFIWCHGAGFDEPIWAEAARLAGQRVPWHYRNVRCCRTILGLAGLGLDSAPRVGVHHSALADAVHQATLVQMAYSKIANRGGAVAGEDEGEGQ